MGHKIQMAKAKIIKEHSTTVEQFFIDLISPLHDNGKLDTHDLMFILTLALGKVIWLYSIIESNEEDEITVIENKIDYLIDEVNRILPECIEAIGVNK